MSNFSDKAPPKLKQLIGVYAQMPSGRLLPQQEFRMNRSRSLDYGVRLAGFSVPLSHNTLPTLKPEAI